MKTMKMIRDKIKEIGDNVSKFVANSSECEYGSLVYDYRHAKIQLYRNVFFRKSVKLFIKEKKIKLNKEEKKYLIEIFVRKTTNYLKSYGIDLESKDNDLLNSINFN